MEQQDEAAKTKPVTEKESRKKKTAKKKSAKKKRGSTSIVPKYPRHPLERALRIPKVILDQNAGKECSEQEAARFLGINQTRGPFTVEISSAIKFGLLARPAPGRLSITELSKKILRPQNEQEELEGLREAVLKAPEISAVYSHYRGENLPDEQFFDNALTDKFGIPAEKVSEFRSIFFDTLQKAQLVDEHEGKARILDISGDVPASSGGLDILKKLGKKVVIDSTDSCFVVMPFADPHGSYYDKIYKPAIEKAGLKAIRADNEIFGAGKIMDQVWSGMRAARVLVAELTTRNPNVFYELGLAHALQKPVVLVSSNEEDVPFDLKHIRVIYYDVNDPFWGSKLLEKVAENVLSAIKNPEEAVFRGPES